MGEMLSSDLNLLVREATMLDAPRIAQVHVETWQSAYLGIIPDAYLQSLSIDQRMIAWERILSTKAPKTHYAVSEVDGAVVGFIGVGPCRDEDAPSDQGEVFAIYVDRDKQGFGIGSRLLEQGLQFLRAESFKTAALWVLAENESSRFWYQSRGWRNDGRVKSEHRGNFDLIEVRYVLPL